MRSPWSTPQFRADGEHGLTIACNGVGGRVDFVIRIARADPLMRTVPGVRNDMPRLTYLTYCHAYKRMRVGRLIGALRRLTSKMAAIGKADWQIHDWRGELIDRRLDYYQ